MKTIETEVLNLILKHNTNNPFKICKLEGICCVEMDLHPEIKGILQCVDKHKFIYINKNLTSIEKLVTCGHELGHATLYNIDGCSILKTNTNPTRNIYEIEADVFALLLLVHKVLTAPFQLEGTS